MGTCACGQPVGLVPRACRLADHALLWPPVRVNADGTEHRCRAPKARAFRVVEPVPGEVQARLVAEAQRELAEATAVAVGRLAATLTAESEARQDYYRARAGAGRPAPRGAPEQPQAPVGNSPPAPTQPQQEERSLSDEIAI